MTIAAEPLKPHIGARIHVDRASLLDEDVIQTCLQLLEERIVLVFPRLGLSDAEQLALTDRLGSRVYYASNVPGGSTAGSDVYEITLDKGINTEPEYVLSTFFWHFDGAHGHIAPPKASLLAGWRVAKRGGQTEFTYRHHWQEGDLVICNNPGALHRVIPYDAQSGRVVHRTTVAGVELIA